MTPEDNDELKALIKEVFDKVGPPPSTTISLHTGINGAREYVKVWLEEARPEGTEITDEMIDSHLRSMIHAGWIETNGTWFHIK